MSPYNQVSLTFCLIKRIRLFFVFSVIAISLLYGSPKVFAEAVGEEVLNGQSDTEVLSISAGDFTFLTTGTSATLTSYEGLSDVVTIPAEITDGGMTYTVTAIGDSAFEYTAITSVTIPDSVTSIGDNAFGYTAITSVTIPESVTLIGDGAFNNCRSLLTITLPDSIGHIGQKAFYECRRLESITIPDGLENIEDSTFSYCGSLENISIPDSVNTIGNDAFRYCGFKNISLPTSITSIGEGAFYNCTSLETMEIPYGVTSVEYCAFFYCTSLTSVIIPDTGISLGSYAFAQCTSLTEVSIPDSITSIGFGTFSYCTALSSVTFSDSSQLSSIGEFAFERSGLTSIVIPDGVTCLAHGAFYECTNLESVMIPSSVTCIEGQVFSYCSKLSSLIFEDGIELSTFGDYVFAYCTSLASIALPDTLTSINMDSFNGCSSLESVIIPDSVTSIEERAFYDCSSLSYAYFMGKQPQMESYAFDNNASDFNIYYHISLYSYWEYSTTSPYYLKFLLVSQPFCMLTLYFEDGSEAQSSFEIIDRESRLFSSAPDDPSREGYTFGGWYLDSLFTTAFDFDSDTVSDDLVLYARWIPEVLKINEIILCDTSGEELDTIPSNADFMVQVSIDVPEMSGSSYYVILAFYGADGRFNDIYLTGPVTTNGQIMNISFDIEGKDHDGDQIKAIIIDGTDSFKPLTDSAARLAND